MSVLLRIAGAALIALFALVFIKSVRPEFVLPLRLAAAAVVFGAAFLLSEPVVTYLRSLADGLGLGDRSVVIFRALAAAFLSQIVAGICRENGEATLASGVEFAGRTTVLVLCLPLLEAVLTLAGGLLE